jgi:pimeloyl-ACP methyl ester carboxylesterase
LPDLSEPNAFSSYVAKIPNIVANASHTTTTGTYDIAATYCAPKNRNLNEVQLLVHGAASIKEYWMGGAWNRPNIRYSWTKYANDNGFATLAVDRLGNGLSAHPDPLQEVQLTMEVEILNILAKKIKSGEITGTPSKVVYVGHSMGSFIGTILATKYPNNIDKLVLTGYTSDFSNFPAAFAAVQTMPAKILDPARFSTLPQGYLTIDESGRTAVCYAGNYDPNIPPLDFATEGTFAIGEILEIQTVPVPNYPGPVFILTGDMDKFYCGAEPNAPCEAIIKTTASEFPSASKFGYFMPKNTGHSLNFHRSAHRSFKAVTDWLLHASNNH